MTATFARRTITWICGVALATAFAPWCSAGDWPGWRGPTGQGTTDETNLPLVWNGKTGENVHWKTELHGGRKKNPEFSSPGWSCPIVWKDRVFLTTSVWPEGQDEKERRASIAEQHVLCFQVSDGTLLWDAPIPSGKCLVDNFYHGYTTPTPVTDGKHVFALFGSGILAAVDFSGNITWSEVLPRMKDVDAGVCSSPILYEDTVIVVGIGMPGLRALDKQTGKVKWEQNTKEQNAMSTPAVIRVQGKPQLIHFAGGIQSLDPETGELHWFCRNVTAGQSSPVFAAGLIYADAGRGGNQCNAVDATGTGDVGKTHIKWQAKTTTAAGSSAIVVGDYIYRGCDPGIIRCRELKTGELVYEERAEKLTPSASPIATPEGRIYFASPGRSFVIQAGPTFELLATNDLDDGPDYSTPAVSNGRIFIKGKSNLWCIGTKPPE